MSESELIKIQNSLEHSFGEMLRAAVSEQLKAKFAGDTAKFNALVKAEETAREKLLEARRRAIAANLSSEQIDALVDKLSKQAGKARDLLDNLRQTKKVLENLKKAAELATAILKTVAAILA